MDGSSSVSTSRRFGSLNPLGSRATPSFTPALFIVGLAAMALRLWELLANGGLHSAIEYDDGVHYGSALLLLHGQVPYRDIIFLQPPGITVLLVPAAALGLATKVSIGFAAARIATAAAAGLATVLLGRLIARQSSPRRGLIAAAIYATSLSGIIAGSTVLIEPWLSLMMLLSLTWLLPEPHGGRSIFLAGAAAGIGCSLKVWGFGFTALVVLWLLVQRKNTEAKQYCIGAAGSTLLIYGPFLLLGARSLVTDVVTTQASRPPAGIQGWWPRWQDLTGSHAIGGPHSASVIAAATGLLLVVCVIRAWTLGWFGRLVTLQLLGGLGLFVLGAPYYTHYGQYLLPFLAAAVALAFPAATWRSVAVGCALLVVAFSGMQAYAAMARTRSAAVNAAALRRLTEGHSCVVSDEMTLLVLANANLRCAWLDPRGDALTRLHRHAPPHFYPYGFTTIQAWQVSWRRRLNAASLAIVAGSPGQHAEWGAPLRSFFLAHFRPVERVGTAGPNRLPVEVWERRPS